MDTGVISIILSFISTIIAIATPLIVIGRCKEKVDHIEKDIDKSNNEIKELCDKVARLTEFKTQTQKFVDSKIYQSHSPLSLTPFGKKLVKESGFDDIFQTVKDDLVKKLEATRPNSKYEVQENARALMDSLDNYKAFTPIESYAYEHGVDYNQILRAGAIQLRDYYLETHPKINDRKEIY